MAPYYDEEDITLSIQEATDLDEDEVQVVFTGPSHATYGIDPMRIYKNTGLVTYNMGLSAQHIEISYYMAQKAVEKGAKVFVLDASVIFRTASWDVPLRYIIESDKMSDELLELEDAYIDSLINEDKLTQWVNYGVPIVRNHARWSSLSEDDFINTTNYNYFLQGYVMSTVCAGADHTVDDVNEEAREMYDTQADKTERFGDGEWETTVWDDTSYSVETVINATEYLEKIKTLLDENDCELLLIKVPVNYYLKYYTSAWTKEKSDYTKMLSEEMGIKFLDLLYDADLDIDWGTDTIDGGAHLNYNGAKKVSDFLGEYLLENYDLNIEPNKSYDEKLLKYNKLARMADFESAYSAQDYLELLADEASSVDVFISAAGSIAKGLNDEDIAYLKALGLQCEFEALGDDDAYIAIIEQGKILYEGTSNRKLTHYDTLSCGIDSVINSSGDYAGATASIILNGEEYGIGDEGINIAVYDHEIERVIDSALISTGADDNTCSHASYLLEYKKTLFNE